jgi:hypothetical protein
MIALLPVVFAFQATVGVSVGTKCDSACQARAAARTRTRGEAQALLEETGIARPRREPRRVAVTPALLASAFKDPAAKSLLLRARASRLVQDSLLASYDATTYQRLSVGMGLKAIGRDRLALRHEDASRVQWERGKGALVELKGDRTAVPIASGAGTVSGNVSGLSPVPYYPGREQLWIGGGLAQSEVDEREFVHPIADGAEAYYTYATGDSVTMGLPDGKTLTLRELKIAARSPKWNLSVGSFWFDEESAHLVRAVYRISEQLDVWALADEESQRSKADSAARAQSGDTTGAALGRGPGGSGGPGGRGGRGGRNANTDDGVPFMVKAMLSPMKVDVSAITMEYGLYNQRFWLPRAQAFEGKAQAGFIRIPVTMEQKFKYESVNALEAPLPIIASGPTRLVQYRDSLNAAKTPAALRDSLMRIARASRVKELAALKEKECAASGTYTRQVRRYQGTLNVMEKIPCDSTTLANSPDLPPSIYDPGDELFGSAERETLVKALGFGLQPGWGPQKIQLAYGLSQTRYNRVEGFGTGIVASSVLGKGYTASLGVRGAFGDRQLNTELGLSRTNGRSTIKGSVYRRLSAMNDWGTPLDFGASLGGLLYARDEGAYYRNWGAELTGTTEQWGQLDWRLFGERQWDADVNSRWTLFGGGNDSRFLANPAANRATEYGAAVRLHNSAGIDPKGWRVLSDLRLEGAGGDLTYGRGMADITVSKSIGPLAAALTASGGLTAGAVPVQRLFYLGGSQSIRGQTALTGAGDAFWMTRAELGTSTAIARPIIFFDAGWAGDRRRRGDQGRPMSGAGVGASFLDGAFRVDLSRGIYPTKQTRLDFYLEARF